MPRGFRTQPSTFVGTRAQALSKHTVIYNANCDSKKHQWDYEGLWDAWEHQLQHQEQIFSRNKLWRTQATEANRRRSLWRACVLFLPGLDLYSITGATRTLHSSPGVCGSAPHMYCSLSRGTAGKPGTGTHQEPERKWKSSIFLCGAEPKPFSFPTQPRLPVFQCPAISQLTACTPWAQLLEFLF